ncbi:MAG: hypothetical protein ICV74_05065 [Thermoleophilia bacterium]|nr:hypothetical protein [Thermoleophilia bacterium]
MRRLTLTMVLVVLACAPAASAQLARAVASGGESLALSGGTGWAVVTSRDGAIVGNVRKGSVRIVDLPRLGKAEVGVTGCEKLRRPNRRTRVCSGRRLSFSVIDGNWRVAMRGVGINASAVLKGRLVLQGTAGTYSLRHGDPKPWPRRARTFRLG